MQSDGPLVGGRLVLSAAGLISAAAVGIDIDALRELRFMKKMLLENTSMESNPHGWLHHYTLTTRKWDGSYHALFQDGVFRWVVRPALGREPEKGQGTTR